MNIDMTFGVGGGFRKPKSERGRSGKKATSGLEMAPECVVHAASSPFTGRSLYTADHEHEHAANVLPERDFSLRGFKCLHPSV